MVTPPPGHGRLRASHADREQVVGLLKAAYVQGRLTRDELDGRMGLALAARTYSELAVLTADLPAGPDGPPPRPGPDRVAPTAALTPTSAAAPAPARARTRNPSANRAVKSGAGAIARHRGPKRRRGGPRPARGGGPWPCSSWSWPPPPRLRVRAHRRSPGAESRHRNRSRRRLPPGPPPAWAVRRPRPRPPPIRRAGAAGARPDRSPSRTRLLTRDGALPRGGRTDRGLAAGHGAAEPAGLVLAGSARSLRRGRAGPGLGHGRPLDVLRGGVPDHRRRALAVRRPAGAAVDGCPPGGVRAALGGCGLFTGVGGWAVVLHELAGAARDDARHGWPGGCSRSVAAHARSTGDGVHWHDLTEMVWGTAGIGASCWRWAPITSAQPRVDLAVRAGDWLLAQAEAAPPGSGGPWAGRYEAEHPTQRRFPNFATGPRASGSSWPAWPRSPASGGSWTPAWPRPNGS